ncbi:hypothetical protein E2C01_029919 [Portunus trituberculatus]|uniref:Uncharacterized protein n=1 Tax=Portunus trituberculatus TaxID=210409 RepID=A0A5B7EPK7_PORTR|nr:hypothetical protein [Portunus trituberculatus]
MNTGSMAGEGQGEEHKRKRRVLPGDGRELISGYCTGRGNWTERRQGTKWQGKANGDEGKESVPITVCQSVTLDATLGRNSRRRERGGAGASRRIGCRRGVFSSAHNEQALVGTRAARSRRFPAVVDNPPEAKRSPGDESRPLWCRHGLRHSRHHAHHSKDGQQQCPHTHLREKETQFFITTARVCHCCHLTLEPLLMNVFVT